MTDYKTLGKKIESLRISRRLPLSEMSKMMGMNSGNLSKIEKGDVLLRRSQVIEIARTLGVESYELLDLVPDLSG